MIVIMQTEERRVLAFRGKTDSESSSNADSFGSDFRLWRLIKRTARGPPVKLPMIIPSVAAATPISVAPTAPMDS